MATLTNSRNAILQVAKVSNIRELSRADLAHLANPRPAANAIKSIRDSHHRIARAIAAGLANHEISAMYGMTAARISVLRNDPAFAELIAHYRSIITVEFIREVDPVLELMGSIRTKSLAMLNDKIDDAAEKNEFLPTRELVSISELGLDRTGYGKVNKNLNVNVDFAANLEKARSRSRSARQIDASPSPPLTVAASPSSFRRL